MNRLLLSIMAIFATTLLMACSDGGAPFGNVQGPKKPASAIADEEAKARKLAKDPSGGTQAYQPVSTEAQPAK